MPRPRSTAIAPATAVSSGAPSAPINHTSKPDADNLAKLVLDRITEGGWIWRDDAQVAKLKVEKYWAITDARIGVYVTIESVQASQA